MIAKMPGQMAPNERWIKGWEIGLDPSRELEVSQELINFFVRFWKISRLDDKSKTTRGRYSAALQSLGGYLVEHAISEDGVNSSADELIKECVDLGEGPLIYPDNEVWQSEIDTVSRKLLKYIRKEIT